MVSWISACITICALSLGVFSFPVIEEHQEIGIPETVVGHEETFDHHIGLSQELLEPKHATSYQSFHLESKHAVPVVIKTIHPPTPIKHFSAIEDIGSKIGVEESFGHGIAEIEPIDLKLHGI